MTELKDILEALVFVHRVPLNAKTMENVLKDEYSAEEIRAALDALKEDYSGRAGVVELVEVAGGFEFCTREDMAEWIRKMDHFEHHRRLSRPALETLAIVAYRQPVTRPEIEAIRGVNVDGIMRSLAEKKLVRVLGRKDVPGKPLVYGTSTVFLEYFGLKKLSDLPSLQEFIDQEELEGAAEEGTEEGDILPLGEEEEQSGEGEDTGESPEAEA
jgi:segregation and condensation protein B